MSAIQINLGYVPSMPEIPSFEVNTDVPEEHIETMVLRWLKKGMRSKDNNMEPKYAFKKGDQIWVYYMTSETTKTFIGLRHG